VTTKWTWRWCGGIAGVCTAWELSRLGVRVALVEARKYLLELAADLVRRGGRIYQHTRMTDLEEGRPCLLTTASGATLVAEQVVVTTGSRCSPVSRRTVNSWCPGTADVSEWFAELERWMLRHFKVESIDYRWAAQDHTTTDQVPFIGRFPGAMAGRLLSRQITRQSAPPWADLYDPIDSTFWRRCRRWPVPALPGSTFRDRPTRYPGCQNPRPVKAPVVDLDGDLCGVYRDGSGVLSAVSATCS
jgi:glycine/D-amino acid oxidase-like deaminating enzyme